MTDAELRLQMIARITSESTSIVSLQKAATALGVATGAIHSEDAGRPWSDTPAINQE